MKWKIDNTKATSPLATILVAISAIFQLCAAEPLRAFQSDSSVDIFIGNKLFTSYHYNTGEKYPYFFPLNGNSGASLTSMRNELYPHQSSLWIACDRVNGGNYWQNELTKGRIITEQLSLIGAERNNTTDLPSIAGNEITIEQVCIWRRPNAPEPLRDYRRFRITAPDNNMRLIETTLTLEALTDVTIEKTNHSLFCLRVANDLSVPSGGKMLNASGGTTEQETFGKPSPWLAFYGTHKNGAAEGIAICQHPQNPWYPSPWFARDYGLISPTPLFWPEQDNCTRIASGKKLTLRYLTAIFHGTPESANLKTLFDNYIQSGTTPLPPPADSKLP